MAVDRHKSGDEGSGWWPFGQSKEPSSPALSLTEAASAPSAKCPFWKGKQARLQHGRTNYVLLGPETAPLVVCIHGLAASIATFEKMVPLLTQRGLRVLVYDLYGFGLSAHVWSRLTPQLYVKQLLQLLAFLRVSKDKKVSLMGHSMGGVVAVEFARLFESRVSRLLLVAPGGLLQAREAPCAPFLFNCIRGRFCCCLVHLLRCICLFAGSCAKRRLQQAPHIEDMATPDVRDEVSVRQFTQANKDRLTHNVAKTTSGYVAALRHMPLWEKHFGAAYGDLARKEVSVLFVWGGNDNTVPWAEVRSAVIRRFAGKGTSCIIIPGGGHGLLLEDAEHVSTFAAEWFLFSEDRSFLKLLEKWRLPSPGGPPVGP
uniref:AB hydrolase-1 domain-containing protein n=1 Tax=Noctiluca scintillans TaxID=2966 RepID=A0A7S1EX40_NOCSC